jgi:hypothetical protein
MEHLQTETAEPADKNKYLTISTVFDILLNMIFSLIYNALTSLGMLNNIAYIYYVIHMYVVTSQSQLMAL